MEKRQLEVANKAEFLKLLDAISKINDSGVILDLQEDKITSLVSSIDNTLILFCLIIFNDLIGVNFPTSSNTRISFKILKLFLKLNDFVFFFFFSSLFSETELDNESVSVPEIILLFKVRL